MFYYNDYSVADTKREKLSYYKLYNISIILPQI